MILSLQLKYCLDTGYNYVHDPKQIGIKFHVTSFRELRLELFRVVHYYSIVTTLFKFPISLFLNLIIKLDTRRQKVDLMKAF